MGETLPDHGSTRAGPYRGRSLGLLLLVAVVAALAAAGGTALLVNIVERKQEARNPFYRVVELTDETEDPAVWGRISPCNTSATYGRLIRCAPASGGARHGQERPPTRTRAR